jgi:hypothetical protein
MSGYCCRATVWLTCSDSTPASVSAGFCYECSGEKAALLVLGRYGIRTSVDPDYKPWVNGIERLGPVLWDIVEEDLQLDLKRSPLLVVTGHVKTSSPWKMFVSQRKSNNWSVSLGGGVQSLAMGHFTVSSQPSAPGFEHCNESFEPTDSEEQPADTHPSGFPDEHPDQCVFIRCAKIRRRNSVWPTGVFTSFLAGPN